MTPDDRNDPRIEMLATRLAYAYQLGSMADTPYPPQEQQLAAEGLATQHWQDWTDEAVALLARLDASSKS